MIFFDIDTQVDFLEPDGALYVPQGVTLHGAIGRLLGAARRTTRIMIGTLPPRPVRRA